MRWQNCATSRGLNDLDIGVTEITDIEGSLPFAGLESDIEAAMLVPRLFEDCVLVTTANFIMLSTADLGRTAGIDKLMELTNLLGITHVTLVSVRKVF